MKEKKDKAPQAGLRVLILEDNPADAEMVTRELRRAKLEVSPLIVAGRGEFSRALSEFQPQVILSDFKLPAFDGLTALSIARAQAPEVPFIFVSGSIGEERAIETLALGASDYIFKDNLARLAPAVRRLVEAAQLRLDKKIADDELRRNMAEIRFLSEATAAFVHLNNLDELYASLAAAVSTICGADFLIISEYDAALQAVRPRLIQGLEPFQEEIGRRFRLDPLDMVFYLKDMRPDDFNDFVSRRLRPVRGGLYGLANHKIPQPVCRVIEKLLGIASIHGMGFSWENQLYGGLTILFKQGHELRNPAQVEALVNLAAVSVKRLLAEKSLRASERMYATLVSNLPGFVYRCRRDRNWTMEYVSNGIREITGYLPEDFIHNRKLAYHDIIHPDHQHEVRQRLEEDLRNRRPFEMEYRIRTAGGAIHWIWERGQGLFNPDGSLQFLEGFITDITARKQAELLQQMALEESERLRAALDQVPVYVYMKDLQSRYIYANQLTLRLFACAPAELAGTQDERYFPPATAAQLREIDRRVFAGETTVEEVVTAANNDDERIYHEVKTPLRGADGTIIGLLGISDDISRRRHDEKRIRTALKEKEVLLQEIHHRVKNNLQVISGLLTLQADQTDGKSLAEIFHESQDRIRSIALIHEKLYRSHNLAEIPFDEYLRDLTANLLSSHGVDAGRVTVAFDVEAILFTIEKAIPLGLIVNELLTNALKHAFPGQRHGHIRIGMHGCLGGVSLARKTDSGPVYRVQACEITVADDGVGLPQNQAPDQGKTMGVKLISMLARQLQAEISFRGGAGTEVRIVFPEFPAASSAGSDSGTGGHTS
jgi:PAS domain S-box-containing protein